MEKSLKEKESLSEISQEEIPKEDSQAHKTPKISLTKNKESKPFHNSNIKSSGKDLTSTAPSQNFPLGSKGRRFGRPYREDLEQNASKMFPNNTGDDPHKRKLIELQIATMKFNENKRLKNESKRKKKSEESPKKIEKETKIHLSIEEKKNVPFGVKIARLKEKSPIKNWIIAISLVLSINFTGYYMVICNVMAITLTKNVFKLPEESRKIAAGQFGSFFAMGYLFANINMGVVTRHIGRVRAVLVMELLKIIIILLYRVKDFRLFLCCRAATGMISGFQEVIVPVIMNEMMPPKIASTGGVLFYPMRTLFMLLTSLMPVILGTEGLITHWKDIFTWPIIFCFITFFAILTSFGLRETPEFYIENTKNKKKLGSEIHKTMKVIYTKDDAREYVNLKLAQVKHQKKKFKETDSTMTWKRACTNKYRNQLITGVLTSSMKEFGGIAIMLFLSTQIFEENTNNGVSITVIISIANMVGGLLCLYMIRKKRRTGLLGPAFFYMLSCFGLVVGTHMRSALVNSICTFVFISSYGSGLGSVLRIYLTEILPPLGLGISLAAQWLSAAMIVSTYPLIMTKIGIFGIMLMNLFSCITLFLIIYFKCHETKGYTKEEIIIMFAQGRLSNPQSLDFSSWLSKKSSRKVSKGMEESGRHNRKDSARKSNHGQEKNKRRKARHRRGGQKTQRGEKGDDDQKHPLDLPNSQRGKLLDKFENVKANEGK